MLSLDQLAIKYGSDKSSLHHGYCRRYEQHFAPFQNQRIDLIELGIGGYHYPDRGGASLKMWQDWFHYAQITGIDIYNKIGITGKRITTIVGSQDDAELPGRIGFEPTIVIDDASHINHLTIAAFRVWFPVLKPGGIYVIEDVESSWCPANEWASGCDEPADRNAYTSINFCRWLVEDLNSQYIIGYQPQYQISAIHFYKNIVFIEKA